MSATQVSRSEVIQHHQWSVRPIRTTCAGSYCVSTAAAGPPTVAPAFITTVVAAALEHGYHVVLEGILHTGPYGEPLRQLIAEHAGPSFVYWLEVSFDETVRRHQQRGEPTRVTAEQMRGWYTPLNLLDAPGVQIITESSKMEATVDMILHRSGLRSTMSCCAVGRSRPLTYCCARTTIPTQVDQDHQPGAEEI